jgi:hypothetical protein
MVDQSRGTRSRSEKIKRYSENPELYQSEEAGRYFYSKKPGDIPKTPNYTSPKGLEDICSKKLKLILLK